MQIEIKAGERVEELGGGVRVIQNPEGFCYGTDAVMLAGFTSAKPSDKLIDFCSGTGIVPLLLSMLTKCADMTAIELQEQVADMAARSVRMNGLESRIHVFCADLRNIREHFAAESMDVVTCNPPYMKCNTGKQNASDSKTIARHEVCCTLQDVMENAAYLLKTGGRLYMVHRPERLADIMFWMKQCRLEPKRLQFVHASPETAPSLVLIEGQKGRASGLKVLAPKTACGISELMERSGGNYDK